MSAKSDISPQLLEAPEPDHERNAFVKLDPSGFFIRHPPKPHLLESFITPDEQLFQTIHMGAAVVDPVRWILVVDGLVENPFAINLEALKKLPCRTVTSFHECYGSPLKPATTALWRIGNVRWTGVPLNLLLAVAKPLSEASYVWSEGLDRGEFAGVKADRYQKDLPLEKAIKDEVLLAFELNGKPLSRKRGAPVRLVVPGWFGTNSTKWISRITLQDHRATGPFTTKFYNEPDPNGPKGAMRPVWSVEPNSMIVTPKPDEQVVGTEVRVEGWAWSSGNVDAVEVSFDEGRSWLNAKLEPRMEFSWQKFSLVAALESGDYTVVVRATSQDGLSQPVSGRRNHCHCVAFRVAEDAVNAVALGNDH